MSPAIVMLCLVPILGRSSPPVSAEPPITDPEVLKGIRLVDEAEYDVAILTLDAAARRLAAQPGQSTDLGQAYLYLGVAYLAKGHEISARAQFREALARIKDLRLSPDKFAPRVIEAFEKARQEQGRPIAAPSQGGSKTKWLVIGGSAAAAAAAVLLLDGDGVQEVVIPGTLEPGPAATRPIGIEATASGTLEATLSWGDRRTFMVLFLDRQGQPTVRSALDDCGVQETVRHSFSVTPGTYTLRVYLENCQGIAVTYTLTLRGPMRVVSQ